ncbi:MULTISPECIES: hypothetical protein [unclassified Fusibacter]|uniref:hypothetical protein n=1 Tax=unclassified Fusibacter TaxID=2624464 RepID=UPI001011DF9F|nr:MULTISPECIES: hypothetical protein [unclassified Fusibacter]MCK8059212.1 hypothetical protein [Fusibacter sp. A2]NPE21325.1 hypothetical protein [Fusibacter sp. A1]RXV62588.1 hypothetical protein DWB64_05760 [Fusibacter sp. A1]
MINLQNIKHLTGKIEELLESEDFTPIEVVIIRQKYLDGNQKLDVRRMSREFHKPMKHIVRDIEKLDKKLYNLLKKAVVE